MRLFANDKTIVDPAIVDMRIGNPSFLKPYWKIYADSVSYPSNLWSSMDYEKEGGRQSLKEKIILLHKEVKNANCSNRKVVIGNGATQILNATIYAYKVKYGLNHVVAKSPYWFRFPEMSKMLGSQFSDFDILEKNWLSPKVSTMSDSVINIATCPSNPENKMDHWSRTRFMIWDMCYAWPQYTSDISRVDEDAMVFSLAKATGHGASRIGWGLYKDPDLVDLVQKYIEYDTGGVSVEAQTKAEYLITNQLAHVEDHKKKIYSCFYHGRPILNKRWEQIKAAGLMNDTGQVKSKIRILNKSGMFAWCEYMKGSGDIFNFMKTKYNILVLPGVSSDSFGINKFRLNVGCDEETFQKFIKKFT